MRVTEYIRNFIANDTLVFWAGNTGADGCCDLFRAAGFTIHDDGQHITIYLTDKYASKLIRNMEHGKHFSFLATSILSFESYQFKGLYVSSCPASEKEENQISFYTEKLLPALQDQGLSHDFIYTFIKGSKSGITIRLTEIFEQTPKHGTGKEICT